MAAGYNLLLRTLLAFLLFSSLACLYCQRKSSFKDIYYRNQAGFWITAHPTPSSWINYYFNVTFHFKRRPHGFISDKLSALPISKSTKHGLITLALPHSFFDIDLTICMDVHCNPGPDLEKSSLHCPAAFRTEICILLARPLNLIIHDSNCWI